MSFRFRLILTISLVIALAFGIGGTLLICASFQTSLEEETTAALESFTSVEETLQLLTSMTHQTDTEEVAQTLMQIEQMNPTNFAAVRLQTEGDVVYYARNSERIPQELLPLPAWDQCVYTRVSDDYGYGLLVLHRFRVGAEVWTFTARFDLTPVYTSRQTQLELFFSVYWIVVLFGMLIAVVLSVTMTGRLKKLTGAVQKISDGDLSMRSGLSSRDEFGRLSHDFDAMADKLQENIQQLETELERREQFMGAFAHEIKTPMTSIIGYADLLRQDGLDNQTRLLAADYVFSEGQRLEKLSFQLLDLLLLKQDAPQFADVNLAGFLSEIQRLMAPELEARGITLTCHGEVGTVRLEPNLAKSLLYNLIDNGAKAIEGFGSITVIGTVIPGGCEFRVRDTGRGMEASELNRITEAFYRVDKARSRQQGGAGLGLALCKEIAALHRGALEFASVPGEGTEVTVQLYGGQEYA